jgi:hypothetical protein
MDNNIIKHKDIVAKIAKKTNLPQELVHTVALAYLDTILTIATMQGHLSIEKMFSISISISPKKLNRNSLNNLKRKQYYNDQSTIPNQQSEIDNPQSTIKQKPSIRVKFHPKVVDNILALYEKSFSPQTLNQTIASISNTLMKDLHRITEPPTSPKKKHSPASPENPNPSSSFEHILTLEEIAKKP